MNIKEYSAKSFVVIGEKTKEYKEELKELGGKYNALLKCGPAWIFPNPRKSDLVLFLNSKGFGEGITPSETKNSLPLVTELESTFILVMKNLDIKERFTVLEKLISLLKNVDSYKEEEKVEKKNKKKTPTEAVKTEEDSENEPEVEVKKENKKAKGKQVEEDTEDVKEEVPEKKVKTDKKKPKPSQKKVKEVSSDSEEETEKPVPVKTLSSKTAPPKTSKKSPKKVENDSDTSVDDDGVEIKVQPRLLPKH